MKYYLLAILFFTIRVQAQLYINTSNFKVMSGTIVSVGNQAVGADLVIADSGQVNNDGRIILDPDATLQETSNQLGLGILRGNGTIEITKNLNAPMALNVGGLGFTLTAVDNLGSTKIVRGHTPYVVNSNASIDRFYQITPTNNTSLNFDAVYSYDQTELNGYLETNLQLIVSHDDITWDIVTATTDATANTATVAGINTFQTFTMQSSSAPLPVELIHFAATSIGNKQVQLTWTTATENNNHYFEVQRSMDGKNFVVIGKVMGNGTSNTLIEYDFTDNYPSAGRMYYRLKQVDFDGIFQFSKLVKVDIDKVMTELEIYPNPAAEYVNIVLKGKDALGRKLVIVNSRGQKIIEIDNMHQYVQLNTSKLQNGFYVVLVYDEHTVHNKKFLVRR